MVYGIERYAHLARYEPANAANRTDPLIGGYDLAPLPNEERSADISHILIAQGGGDASHGWMLAKARLAVLQWE